MPLNQKFKQKSVPPDHTTQCCPCVWSGLSIDKDGHIIMGAMSCYNTKIDTIDFECPERRICEETS